LTESRSQEIHRESVALREYFEALRAADREEVDRRFRDQERSVQAALAAADKAVTKAEIAAEKRADASNEIRQAMVDQQSAFVTKVELTGIERRVSVLEDVASRAAGRSTGTAQGGDLFFKVVAAIAAFAGIAGIIYGLTK
jgi:hypothetical protein